MTRFDDVPVDHLFHDDIEWIADRDITRGINPPENTLYGPNETVSRGQMAAFLHRLGVQGEPGPAGVDGLPGPAGLDGADGAAGTQGIQGLAGTDGNIGLTGPQGLEGEVGPAGPPGDGVDRDPRFGKPPVVPWDFLGGPETYTSPQGTLSLDLQAMLNSIGDGDEVFWPRGRYRIGRTLRHPIVEGVAHRCEGGLSHLNGGGTVFLADSSTPITLFDYNNTGAISNAFAGPAWYNAKFDSVQRKIHTAQRFFNVNRWRTIDCTYKNMAKGHLLDRGTGGDDNAWWEVTRCNWYKNTRSMDIQDAFGGVILGGVVLNEPSDTAFYCKSGGTLRFYGQKIDHGRGWDFFSDGWSVTAGIMENLDTQGIRINDPGHAIRNGMVIDKCEFGTGGGWIPIDVADSPNIDIVHVFAPIFEFGPSTYIRDPGNKVNLVGTHWRATGNTVVHSPNGTAYLVRVNDAGQLQVTRR